MRGKGVRGLFVGTDRVVVGKKDRRDGTFQRVGL